MSLLFNTLFAWKASGTHHKLALDALPHLRRHDADEWQNVFLSEVDAYLVGSKAPDNEFKDFKNHVLHVKDRYWGGAISAAQDWYGKTVQALNRRTWKEAIYNAGVLSHYVLDPFMPFHTGQTEREGVIHRAVEWSITKSYEELRTLLLQELGGWPTIPAPTGDDWLADLIRRGADEANKHYDLLIDHYNFDVGVKDPPAGLDRESRVAVARMLGMSAVSFARVLEKAIAEAGVLVPHVTVSLQAMMQSLAVPIRFLTKKMSDVKERTQLEAMYMEFKRTGKVVETLPEDDKTIRRLHCEEVLKISLAELDKQPVGPIGTKYTGPTKPSRKAAAVAAHSPAPSKTKSSADDNSDAKPAAKSTLRRDDLSVPKFEAKPTPPVETPKPVAKPAAVISEKPAVVENKVENKAEKPSRSSLGLDSPLVDAPSIGPKSAERFASVGVRTVGEFLDADPETLAPKLKAGHITPDVLAEWQDQARLVMETPGLKGHDAQILTGIDVRDVDTLADANARDLLELVVDFCESSAGKRVLRDSAPPDIGEVGRWIVAAKKTRSKAA